MRQVCIHGNESPCVTHCSSSKLVTQMRNTIVREVDNRALVLAVDYLYREKMMVYEVNHLLPAATTLIEHLGLPLLNVPVEGYYHQTEALTEYFTKMRTLQKCEFSKRLNVENMAAYQRLAEVMASPIYGQGQKEEFFTQRLDPLFYALDNTAVSHWSIKNLITKAYDIAEELDDFSLVGIAAYLKDPVVLTALRESVALYGAVALSAAMAPPKIIYKWNVDKALADKVNRFIETFNQLTANDLLKAKSDNVKYFYSAFSKNHIIGRCILIGINNNVAPPQYYHWAIKSESGTAVAEEFWKEEIWTTERYQRKI